MPNVSEPIIDASPAEKFFGLSARPFSLTPDLRFAYHSRSHTQALEQVTTALRRREGLIVVTGPIGTGKTMLCRSMLESFESRTFLSVILDPGLEVEDLLRQVLTDFGIMRGIDVPAAGPISEVTRHQFVSTLQQFLASLIPLQAHAVIMIDEAQRLNARVLEEIRLLSNFETDQAKLLQIVLVGQPDLDQVLRQPGMRQLNQRVARRCELYPLSETEVGDYIERRLTVAASPDALGRAAGHADSSAPLVRFAPEAVTAVAQLSEGIPRIVNTLCDRALDAAYERQIRTIDVDAVLTAAERLQLDIPAAVTARGPRRTPRLLLAAAVAVLVILAIWWAMRPGATGEARRPAASGVAAPGRAAAAAPAAATTADTASAEQRLPAGAGSTAAVPPPATAAAAPAATATPPAAAPGTTVATSTPASGQYQISVAAFRTESRAADVARALADLQVRAAVRSDGTGTWQLVVAGPFPTRDAALAAQETLARNGYSDTRLTLIP